MNSLFVSSSIPLFTRKIPPRPDLPNLRVSTNHYRHYDRCFNPSVLFPSISSSKSSSRAAISSEEGVESTIEFEDFVEKDWSFLDSDELVSDPEHYKKIDRIIKAGEILESSSVMVSIGSEGFIDQLVSSVSCQKLLVVHDSLFALACIKEKYDKVNCWQGELIYVPDKWAPFDVMFLYFLPALPFEPSQIFESLCRRSLPGARLVICHPQGREMLEQQRQQYPDVLVSDLPDKTTLQKAAGDYSFDLTEFIDQHGFYLAVLKFCGSRN